MADTVQQVKEKLSIVDIVAPYVKLTKAGRSYRGLSPFNKEKTPSFFVNPERGTYYCFSSSQGGDIFTFIEKMEGVDFKGALKILAEKAGVPLEYEKGRGEDKGKVDRLREAMAEAEAFYVRGLDENGSAYQYARSRGLTPESIRAWSLGYAPDTWRALLDALTARGFSTDELVAAGLIKEAEGKPGTYYDRFRDRLIFPIKDAAGRTVAFTGRALAKDEHAKYLNSPETELFKKSHILFGMDKAKDAIRARGFALLVEGQFDLVLLHQIGFSNTVALSGTALSDTHLSLIKRYAENLMLALDADRAGLAAAAKSAHGALRMGMRVKAVRLPLGKDPADLARDTPQDLAQRIKEAERIVDFFLNVLAENEPDPHRLIVAVERTVLPLIKAVQSPMEQERFIQAVAQRLQISAESVRASLARVGTEPARKEEASSLGETRAPEVPTPLMRRRYDVLALIRAYPESPLAEFLAKEYARIIGTEASEDDVPERDIFEAQISYGEAPREEEGKELLKRMEIEFLRHKIQEAGADIESAEQFRKRLSFLS